jgi:hypothetical protein
MEYKDFIVNFRHMKQAKPNLTFTCSKKFSDMTPDAAGRFCTDCKISVKDFRALNAEEIEHEITKDATAHRCGNFYAEQLDKPFGNWKDKIITWYQTVQASSYRYRVLKPMMLFLVSSLLILTGCRSRQLAGAYTYDTDSSKQQVKHKKELKQEKTKHTKSH